MLNRISNPLLGKAKSKGSATPPSPLVVVPTNVANPLFLQNITKFSEAEHTQERIGVVPAPAVNGLRPDDLHLGL